MWKSIVDFGFQVAYQSPLHAATKVDFGFQVASQSLSYGPPWAHYLGGYQDRLLGGPLGLPYLCHMAPDGVRRKDYGEEVLG
jgi:hypothetical protein